ncbi:hypothetical protein [Rhodoflexus caldus]|uniref:hypothetical protein n=1 Tax=Rhodoflexus caldus TaxID=2891236 RepID=UPI002029BB6A|nr:hypothetical protein [Rhodoflexus caldus]
MHTFIDNISQVRRFYLVAALAFLFPLVLIFFRESLGMSLPAFRILIFAIVIFITGIFFIVKPAYIRYENDNQVIRLHFYNLLPFPFVKRIGKIIEIRKDEFRDYELNSYNYGLSKVLILLIHERFSLLPYPPVSVSLLNKQQLSELIASLEHWKE